MDVETADPPNGLSARSEPMDDRGLSVVEFALILPIFLVMAALMANGALSFYARSTIVSHAREAVRGVALGYMTKTEAETFARQQTKNDLGVDPIIDLKVFDPAVDPNVTMTIRVDKAQMAKFAPFSNFSPFEISTRIIMRQVEGTNAS
ncbi:MAG: pilus assembly protein [Erythrobacter sp.]|nr:pilus assembly protein [Erythrobacter sp.]